MHRSRTYGIGLVILGLLSVGDVFAPLLSGDGGPPISLAVILSVVGLASLGAIYGAWRGSKSALTILVVLRSLSALSAVPAFFVPGVPAGTKTLAGVAIVATLVGIALAVSGRRVAASAR